MKKSAILFASLASACGAPPRPGSTAFGTLPLRSLPVATAEFSLHPFGRGPTASSASLLLGGQITFTEFAQSALAERLQNPLIEMRLTRRLTPALVAAGSSSYEVSFFARGVPLFGATAAVHRLADGSPFVLGTLPSIPASAVAAAATSWPDPDLTRSFVARQLVPPGAAVDLSFTEPVPYYFMSSDQRLLPVWRASVRINGLPYQVLADASSIKAFSPNFLQVTGTGQIFANDILDGQTVTYTFKDLDGSGTLTNPYLTTVLPAPYTRVDQQNEAFNFPAPSADAQGNPPDPAPTDTMPATPSPYGAFEEVTSFAHTDDHIRWYMGLGFQPYGNMPIQLQLQQLIPTPAGPTTDNALFVPPQTSTDKFTIQVGHGDNEVLRNLMTDKDVPAHESGHYAVYSTLNNIMSLETVTVHEGLADLLVFLQKGNACLGPSICPPDAPDGVCMVQGQCLRTGDNTFAYNDANWQNWDGDAHRRGQVLSGLIWDLVKNNVMSAADAATMTLKAISYFKSNSGIRDFLLVYLMADRELFQCKYDAPLRQFMAARNLTTLIGDVAPGCGNIPVPGGLNGSGLNDPASDTPSTTQTKSSGGGFLGLGSCGTVMAGESPASRALALVLLLISGMAPPLSAALGRRTAQIRSRIRSLVIR